MQARYNDGDAVRINKPTLREHGVTGTVKSYDAATQWYWVELDQGPPWRGKYERSELETPNAKSQATDAALSRQVACTDGLCHGGTERTET